MNDKAVRLLELRWRGIEKGGIKKQSHLVRFANDAIERWKTSINLPFNWVLNSVQKEFNIHRSNKNNLTNASDVRDYRQV